MGDFKPPAALKARLPEEILNGIENHRLVDRTTDHYEPVKDLRRDFSAQRRRYSGIICDIAFDYFLIKHWRKFDPQPFDEFVLEAYKGLSQCQPWMPERMQRVVQGLVKHDWLSAYATLPGVAHSIDQVSRRLRFENKMAGGIDEVTRLYTRLEIVFLDLFPALIQSVSDARLERNVTQKA